MKLVLMSIGLAALAIAVLIYVLWRTLQKNVRDKGGMENPFITKDPSSLDGDDNT